MDYNTKINTVTTRMTVLLFMAITVLTGCSNKKNVFLFKNASEAINACHTELSEIRKLKEPSINELADKAARWVALQDTTYSLMMNDSTMDFDNPIAIDFYAVSDSIRNEIIRAALSKKRTMKDVLYFKVHTARDRDKTQESEDYKKAVKFYAEADAMALYKDLPTTMNEYQKLLGTSTSLQKEQQLLDFIKKEDVCFRSMMAFLPSVTQEQLRIITQETAEMFDNLYRSASAEPEKAVNSRVMLFLSMRFNRRIVQNAQAVERDVKKNITLNDQQRANYRWMIVQPFLSIDNFSMAAITKEQEKALFDIAEELPKTLSSLDGKDYDKSPKDKTEKLTTILTEYFLKSYIKQSL